MTQFNPIIFPGLGISLDPSPVAFSILGKPIYWYGIIIATGFGLAILYALDRCNKEGISQDDFIDLALVITPLSIVGARIYYVVFNPAGYHDIWSIIKIWEGGLAVYGSVIVAFIGIVVGCRIKKIEVLKLADIVAVGFMIGQCVGRWGNFFNREAYGALTDLPWRMEIYSHIYGGRAAVHPTFLYESLWNLIGIILLLWYQRKLKKQNGEIFFLYLIWYGLGRAAIEGLRTDSLYFLDTGLRVSQVLGLVSAALAVAGLLYIKKKAPVKVGGQQQGDIAAPPIMEQTKDNDEAGAEETIAADKEENINDSQAH